MKLWKNGSPSMGRGANSFREALEFVTTEALDLMLRHPGENWLPGVLARAKWHHGDQL